MSNPSSNNNAVSRLASQSDAVGRLAQDSGGFAAVVAAFESKDANAFRWVLERLEMLPYCELICEWVRIKLCALRCAEICLPYRTQEEIPSLQKFANAVVKLTSNEKLLRRVVDAVACGDADAYQAAIGELGLGEFCHLICYWVCSVGYARVCEYVCRPQPIFLPDAANELRSASEAMAKFVKNEKAFDAIGKAAIAYNCETLQTAVNKAGFQSECEILCRFICTWRYVWVCRELCEIPPRILTGVHAIEEAQSFALATRQLANQPRVLGDLVAAVQTRNAKAYREIVTRYGFGPYCWQLCAWIGSVTCHEFCVCICPPQGLIPLFTSVGIYDYTSDINSAAGGNGLTIADSWAFFNTLRLNGVLSQTLGGQPMEYRFETIATDANGTPLGGATWTPVLQSQMAFTLIGIWEHFPVHKKYWVNGVQPGHDGIPAAGDPIVTPDVNGWIQVPQGTNAFSPAGAFSENGNMVELISQSLATWTAADETGVLAGKAAAHLVPNLYFGIRMRVRQVGVAASEQDGGTCTHIAIDDTLYNNITLHPDWDGGLQAPGQLAVRMLDISELIGQPCPDLADTLTVLFTAAHPDLDPNGLSISMTGPGGPYSFTLPAIPEAGDWYGTATPNFTLSDLSNCAYLITLQMGLLLTDGDDEPGPVYDQISFCWTGAGSGS
jgi:hypothetical protein